MAPLVSAITDVKGYFLLKPLVSTDYSYTGILKVSSELFEDYVTSDIKLSAENSF
jgi:hypothetical protein